MKAVPRERVSAFIAACREAAARGLVRCSSGNLSWRLDEGRMLVTRSRSWLGRVTEEDVALCAIADGASLNGVVPTVEVRFHAGVLRARPEVNAVLHYQSPYATAVACLRRTPASFDVIPEVPFYIGPVGRVPYFLPGSEELADAVVAVLQRHDLALMDNHGQVTAAIDFEQALQNAEFFELACQIVLAAGGGARTLSAQAVRELRRARAGGGSEKGVGA